MKKVGRGVQKKCRERELFKELKLTIVNFWVALCKDERLLLVFYMKIG
jgi:hypothetical protein